MALSRQALFPIGSEFIFRSLLTTNQGEDAPMRFPVIVKKKNEIIPMYGYVVTHLSIEDWCLMKGYQLISQQPHRPAFPYERTVLK